MDFYFIQMSSYLYLRLTHACMRILVRKTGRKNKLKQTERPYKWIPSNMFASSSTSLHRFDGSIEFKPTGELLCCPKKLQN